MKLLLDQNLSPKTTDFLCSLGLQATDVRRCGLDGASDEEIYEYARKNKLIIMTFDHEFGYWFTFRRDLPGLVLLRVHPQTLEILHPVLQELFTKVHDMTGRLVTVERHRFRIRKV